MMSNIAEFTGRARDASAEKERDDSEQQQSLVTDAEAERTSTTASTKTWKDTIEFYIDGVDIAGDTDSLMCICECRRDPGYTCPPLRYTEAEVAVVDVGLAPINDWDEGRRSDSDEPPDGGWGWCIVLGCMIIRMASAALSKSRGLFYLQLVERYHRSSTATAWVVSLASILELAVGPIVSVLWSRFSTRQFTCVGGFLMCTGLLMSAFAPSMQFMYFSYGIVVGIGRAFVLTPCPILIGYYFSKRRSLAYGLAAAGGGLGGLAMTPIVQSLFETYGFQGTFIVLAAIVAHIFIGSSLFRSIQMNKKLNNARTKSPKINSDDDALERLNKVPAADIYTCSKQRRTMAVTTTHNHNQLQPDVIKDTRDYTNQSPDTYSHSQHITNNVHPQSHTSLVQPSTTKLCCIATACGKPTVGANSKGNTSTTYNNIKTLLAFSILKDVRFLTYALAKFCLTLPQPGLFLPALVKSRGISDMESAYLLSIIAGADTVFRVTSGVILDFKVFRQIRPVIYNGVVFLHVIITCLYPSMMTFVGFVTLGVCDGAVTGIKNAQGNVVIVDILGIDKFASSMVFTMSFQLLGLLIGPTVSAQLKDIYGTYDGAFYFAGTAIMVGGLIMAGGNIRKFWTDRRARDHNNTTTEIIS